MTREKKYEYALSKRELDIMNVLWEAGKPMIASEIPGVEPSLSINTVQSVLKKLRVRGFIEVAEIVHSGTVLTRSYRPLITPEDYAMNFVTKEVYPFDKFLPKAKLFSALFDSEENSQALIGELEEFIQKKKSETE